MSENPGDTPLSDWVKSQAPVLFLEVRGDGSILATNRFSKELVGRDLVGLNFREVIVDFSETVDPRSLAEEGNPPRRLSVSANSGPPLDFLCSFFLFSNSTWVLGVPDTREAEAMGVQILALNRDLNNLTRELQKANAELMHLDRLKNYFLGMAAHDLRKPLGIIIGYTNLVLEETEGRLLEEERGFLSTVLSVSEDMTKLIDDFLDLSVIESGSLALEQRWVALSSVISKARTPAAVQGRRKGVELGVEEDPAISLVFIDPSRLDQVLANLLSNAIEFSNPGTRVALGTRLKEDRVVLEIRDQGVGMEEEDLKRLFAPFGMAKSKKTGGEKSTGLGLFISKKIVESHGGEISVESRIGEGSVFRVSLPVGPPGEAD